MREELAKAVFCLDLGAAGFSTRFTHAVIAGCVPVWLDELLPPWSGVLPIEDFSVRFSVFELPRLRSIVGNITPQRTVELQTNLRKHAPKFHWGRAFGAAHAEPYPDAFDTLMETLTRRMKQHNPESDDSGRVVTPTVNVDT